MSIKDIYSERLAGRQATWTRWHAADARLGTVRIVLAIAFLALAWAAGARRVPPAVMLVPAGLFMAAVLHHQRVRTRLALAARAVAFYRTGLERLEGQHAVAGPSGAEFGDAHHVYAADLDLFGEQSLFQRLCTARTTMGGKTLARWLLAPADLGQILGRQTCIAELRGRLDLREDLAILGEPSHITLDAVTLTAWAVAPNALSRPWLRAAAAVLAAAAVAGAAVWAVWGLAFPLLAVLVLEAILDYAFRRPVHAAVAGVEHAYEDLKLLAVLLRRIEDETFEAPALRALQDTLKSNSQTASTTLTQLATLVNFVEARRNPLLIPVMLPLLYTLQAAMAAERWRQRHGHAVESWLRVLGEIEALQSFAAYSVERPADPFPEFVEGPATFTATALGHPLLAAGTRVCNDVDLGVATRVLLVSGSNMSGKSTLLRAVGVNAVLAMAGAPVCAARLRLTPLEVGASIRVNDSLHAGSSRFYAEITRLKQLFEPSPVPLLFLLDELLQGTNSKDRLIGAEGVVRALLKRGAIGLVTTHDLALADLAVKNVHFQDELRDGRLSFDFKLRDGVVTHSNGIELMRAIGLEV